MFIITGKLKALTSKMNFKFNNSWYNKREERQSDYKEFATRLQSFKNWPSSAPVNPRELVAAGLYYTGLNDRVKCAWCFGVIHNWVHGDSAFGEHHKHFPNCEFIKHSIVNVYDEDVAANKIQTQLDLLKSEVTCRLCKHERADTLFIPCRHLICCENCAASTKHCTLCEEFIEGTIKTLGLTTNVGKDQAVISAAKKLN